MFRHLIDTDDWCNFHSLSSGRFDCRRQPIRLSVLFSDNHDNVNELWTDQIYQKNLFELQRGSLTVLSKSDWYLSADGLRFLMMSFFFIFWKSPIQLLKSPPFLGTFLKWQMRIFWIENGFFSFVIAVYLKFMASSFIGKAKVVASEWMQFSTSVNQVWQERENDKSSTEPTTKNVRRAQTHSTFNAPKKNNLLFSSGIFHSVTILQCFSSISLFGDGKRKKITIEKWKQTFPWIIE